MGAVFEILSLMFQDATLSSGHVTSSAKTGWKKINWQISYLGYKVTYSQIIRYSLLLNKLSNHNLTKYKESYLCIVTITWHTAIWQLTLHLRGWGMAQGGQTF